MQACELCASPGGEILWQSPLCRVVRVNEPDYPGFCRVIWQTHVREMTDLAPFEQGYVMAVVLAVEGQLRRLYAPDKINLASFGNMTPHVHWHVIPRWSDDRHFPQPVWGMVQRETQVSRPDISLPALAAALAEVLDPIEEGRKGQQ